MTDTIETGIQTQDAAAFMERGILFANRGDLITAAENFSEAINMEPEMAAAYLSRGKTLIASVHRFVSTETDFTLSDTVHYSEKETGIIANAIADFSRALELDPNNADAYKHRGTAYRITGYYERAASDFTRLIEIDSNDADAYNNCGLAYELIGDYKQSIADFTQAIEIDPHNTDIYNNRGCLYNLSGNYDSAIADFTRAIEIDPHNDEAYKNRGITFRNKGDNDRAITDSSLSMELVANGCDGWDSISNYYGFLADIFDDDAIADDYTRRLEMPEYERTIADCTRTIAKSYEKRGIAYYKAKNYEHAIEDLTRAMELCPNDPFCLNELIKLVRLDKCVNL
jgi:tetratricopeptide (TPR) repeat protein